VFNIQIEKIIDAWKRKDTKNALIFTKNIIMKIKTYFNTGY